ncbi:MAG: hypothetical protein ACI33K_08730 [Clostridiaceae bacterium]
MFKALLKTRFLALNSYLFRGSRKGKKHGPLFKLGLGLFVIYIIGSLLFSSAMLFASLCKPLVDVGLAWLYFALAGLGAVALSFIGSVFMAQTQLYDAKDNDLLLSMPIPPKFILASRMLMLLMLNYLYQAFVFIPAAAVYFNNVGSSASALIMLICTFLLLPLIPLTLSCIVGWLIALIVARLRNKNIITIILSLGFLAAYFMVFSQMNRYITALVENGEAIGEAIRKAVFPIYHMGMAITEGNLLSLRIFALCAIVPFAVVYIVLSRSFIKVATSKRGAAKIKYREGGLKVSSVRGALIKKELRHFVSSPMYMMNAALGVIFILVLAGGAIVKRDMIFEILEISPEIRTLTGPMLCLILSGLTATNFISAPSISLEGKNLWVVQSLPVDGGEVLMSKAFTHMVVCIPPLIITATICNFVFDLSLISRIFIYILPIAVTAFTAFLGVAINLKFPKFDWVSETVAVKQGISSLIAMFGSMAIVALPVIIYVKFLMESLSADTYLIICTVLFILLSLGIVRYLKTRGREIFMHL